MIKKFSDFVFKDIGWKLLALFSAIVLYFIVMNVVNPLQRRIYYKTITYASEDVLEERGFIILNRDKLPSTVQLNIQAKQLDINNLYTPAAVTAIVDLSTIDDSYNNRLGQSISLPININLSPVYTIMSKNPESVSIKIDRINSVLWPITVNIVGSVKDGYESMPAVYQDTVTVTAPESVLSEIGSVSADVSITDADKEVVVSGAELHAFNTGNNDITGSVTLSMDKIQVKIPVYPIKTVPVIARIAGSPQTGYWVSEKTASPDSVDIVGPADALAGINDIELAPIQLNGATSDISVDFNIMDYLKDTHLSVSKNGGNTVNVTVKIDKEATKHINMLIKNISLITDNSSLISQLPADPIPITVQGPVDTIGGITSDTLHGELDLTGLSAGIHDVVLHFDLPPSVSVVGSPIKLRVVISEEPSTATILPSQSELPNTGAADGGLIADSATSAQTAESEPPDDTAAASSTT